MLVLLKVQDVRAKAQLPAPEMVSVSMTIAGNIRLEEKIYNTTNILVSLAGLPKETFAAAGIGTGGTSCEATDPVPTPPLVEPEEPILPTN